MSTTIKDIFVSFTERYPRASKQEILTKHSSAAFNDTSLASFPFELARTSG